MKCFIHILTLVCFGIRSNCQPIDEQIKAISEKLDRNQLNVSQVLTDGKFMHLHSLTAFRDIIKNHARQEHLDLVNDQEPGTRIKIRGSVSNPLGKPFMYRLVYVYHTSSKGWYSDTAAQISGNEGDRRHARLFGYFRTDYDGKFEFSTIKPIGYPKSNLPAHIHIEIDTDVGPIITELQFDDDPRLIGEMRDRSLKEGFLISRNTGTNENPVYDYKLVSRN